MRTQNLHLMGIGGVGMAGLAILLSARGHKVSGCDIKASARTRFLQRHGIAVEIGHSSAHLDGVDALIVTPAVSANEREYAEAVRRGLSIRYRGEVLAELVNTSEGIAICGSHGKTTTATWTAKLLLALGEKISWCIGGETREFPVAGIGDGALVVEADESDGTLALYRPELLVVNRCEYDHPDHFKTEADYFACYDKARANAKAVIEAEELDASGWNLPVIGEHNIKNARAAIEVALRRGHSRSRIEAVLPDVVAQLPDRRFQMLREGVYCDYAHHPSEMRCAVRMAREICKGKLRVLFQPHRYSRTRALLADFPAAFEGADEVVLCPTYAAFEKPLPGGDIADLYRECRSRMKTRLYLAPSCEAAWTHAMRTKGEGDVTLILGAGDIVDKLMPLPPRRIWIGHSTNTWKSDLDLGDEYIRTSGRANASGASLNIPWMVGIPGTIGGWIKMNAGAFGHSISEVLKRVKIDGVWRDAKDCGFGYRKSSIEGEIQDYELIEKLPDGEKSEYLVKRKNFPAGTYGSFFKNPEGDFAGRLLEAAGAKELRVGGAFVWKEHANVIVRGEGASASDVLALARLMFLRVYFRFGVMLESEVQGIDLALK